MAAPIFRIISILTCSGNYCSWTPLGWTIYGQPFNHFSAGTDIMLIQKGWIQASRRVTRRLAWDLTCLLLRVSFLIKIKDF